MTQEEILEYKELCAVFIGAEKIEYEICRRKRIEYKHELFKSYDEDSGYSYTKHICSMKFDSDWNWIHEVIEKIEKELKYVIKITSSPTISQKWLSHKILITNDDLKSLLEGNHIVQYESNYSKNESKKEAVVQAIYQFLKWYNNENNR